MVLQGADRESDDDVRDDSAGTYLPTSGHGSMSDHAPASSSMQDLSPVERSQALTKVDLGSVDMDTLYAKKRSLVKFLNPEYKRWLAVNVGVGIIRAQFAVQRPLTDAETVRYAEAIVDADNAATLYRRALLWPAALGVLGYSQLRGPAPPTMSGGSAWRRIFSWRRPSNQFLLAWIFADLVAATVSSRAIAASIVNDRELQSLRRDMESAAQRYRHQDVSMKRPPALPELLPRNGKPQDFEHFDRGDGLGTAKQAATSDSLVNSERQTDVKRPSSPTTEVDFARPDQPSDSYNESTPDRSSSHADPPITGAWDRLRQRVAAQHSTMERNGSDSGQPHSRNRESGSSEISFENETNHADGAWETRRNAGPDAYTVTPGSRYSTNAGGDTLGDSFAFSRTEEERALAKSEAQEEFDRRIEQERHGADFDSTVENEG